MEIHFVPEWQANLADPLVTEHMVSRADYSDTCINMVSLNVKVVPGASRDRVAGRYGDGIKVQVSAPPEDGKANRAVLQVLATFLGVRPDQLQIIRGQTQPRKVVQVGGIEPADLKAKLAVLE